MSSHEQALVPIGADTYHSPDLLDKGRIVDIGLLAESLLYYDRVAIDVTKPEQLDALIAWFDKQAKIPDLIALIRDGTLSFVGYNFSSIVPTGLSSGIASKFVTYILSGGEDGKPECWPYKHILGDALNKIIANPFYVEQLQSAIRDHFLIRNLEEYRSGLENAKVDFNEPKRFSLVVQSFIEELYEIRGLRFPPEAKISVESSGTGMTGVGQYGPLGQVHIDLGLTRDVWERHLGPRIPFSLESALLAECDCDRITRTSQSLKTDLYLPRPMSTLVGDKLYECARVAKLESIIEELKSEVEFPDIRRLVNEGSVTFSDILEWRKPARKFRDWLQDESDRDRNALWAYHNEVRQQIGLAAGARRTITLFGMVAGATANMLIGSMTDPTHQTVAAIVGAGAAMGGINFIVETVTAFKEWRPVVFGNWLSERIKKIERGRQ